MIYKRLESGYHYVSRGVSGHLFAQWPIGEPLRPEHVSSDVELHPERLRLFMHEAAEMAGCSYVDGRDWELPSGNKEQR